MGEIEQNLMDTDCQQGAVRGLDHESWASLDLNMDDGAFRALLRALLVSRIGRPQGDWAV